MSVLHQLALFILLVALAMVSIIAITQRLEMRKRARLFDECADRAAHWRTEFDRVTDEWAMANLDHSNGWNKLIRGHVNYIGADHEKWVQSVGWGQERILESLAMLSSEVQEAKDEADSITGAALSKIDEAIGRLVNICRQPGVVGVHFGEELADIVLRASVLAYRHKIDLAEAIQAKMAKNIERGTRGRTV